VGAQMAPKDAAFDAPPIDPLDGASEPASAASQ